MKEIQIGDYVEGVNKLDYYLNKKFKLKVIDMLYRQQYKRRDPMIYEPFENFNTVSSYSVETNLFILVEVTVGDSDGFGKGYQMEVLPQFLKKIKPKITNRFYKGF